MIHQKTETSEEIKILKIRNPKEFFIKKNNIFENVIDMVRNSFGSDMTEEDIYNHLTSPKDIYLVFNGKKILAMGAYTPRIILGESLLHIEGVAIHSSAQGKGLFKQMTSKALNNERFLGLTTQNPCMHRALEKVSLFVCPNLNCKISCTYENVNECNYVMILKKNFSKEIGLHTDEQSVARGFYGKSLYTKPFPTYKSSSELFDKFLHIDYLSGDSVVCLGVL